jgi:hypothetical protein
MLLPGSKWTFQDIARILANCTSRKGVTWDDPFQRTFELAIGREAKVSVAHALQLFMMRKAFMERAAPGQHSEPFYAPLDEEIVKKLMSFVRRELAGVAPAAAEDALCALLSELARSSPELAVPELKAALASRRITHWHPTLAVRACLELASAECRDAGAVPAVLRLRSNQR